MKISDKSVVVRRSPNTLNFIKRIQNWLQQRYATRQLSATDLFYLMQWAESDIEVELFIEAFDDLLRREPKFFSKGVRLSRLHFEATKLMRAGYKNHQSRPHSPITVEDPYPLVLDLIARLGRQTDNPILRDILRHSFRELRQSQQRSNEAYPNWSQNVERFIAYKAQAYLDWELILESLCAEALKILAPQEQADILEPTSVEKAHLMHLGDEAAARYQSAIVRKKTAESLGFSSLLEAFH